MRRVVNVRARLDTDQIEKTLAEHTEKAKEEGVDSPTRAHVVAGLIYQQVLESLAEAESILQGKDFEVDCDLVLLDPKAIRLAQAKERLQRDLNR